MGKNARKSPARGSDEVAEKSVGAGLVFTVTGSKVTRQAAPAQLVVSLVSRSSQVGVMNMLRRTWPPFFP
ncbi:MAG: hypothetical protein HOO96_00095 [Polyangiaceae bacterium]|nr:hypothetical protein [Polyangiaceae bacterium]